jgi:putative two-component system response regulator
LEDQKRELKAYNDNLQQMIEAKTKTIFKLQNKILTAMSEMVEGRDGITGDHIANTQRYLQNLVSEVFNSGKWIEQCILWNIELLIQSSQLHDIGKIAIKDSILKKPGKLTVDEFEEMKQHVDIGVKFINKLEDDDDAAEDSDFLQYAKTFIAYHHEKWDGSGYPQRLAGDSIPLLGRMMALADVYDALTSQRPYKRAFSPEEAMEIIEEGRGSHFDPRLVDLFKKAAANF